MKIRSCPVSIKAAGENEGTEDGVFEAIVAAYNLDSVGDKIRPGAFEKTLAEWAESGDPIPVYWSHRMDDPDYNIGSVLEAKETDDGLWVRGQLDLESPKSAQVYRLLKGRRVKQFSFAYDVLDGGPVEKTEDGNSESYYELRELKLYELGPTPIGANQETELLGVKSAISAHSTETSDATWDGPENEARLPNDAGAATYRRAFAWRDPDGDEDTKASYRFIHHHVDSDGNVGAASVQACITGIGVLNGGRGGTTIPDADRQGVYNHLARHLRDADQEPPELAAADSDDKHADVIYKAVCDALDRKAGRVLSAKNETRLRDAANLIKEVLGSLEPSSEGDDEKAKPAQPATAEEPAGAKTDEPARHGTASLRQRLDLELLELEVDSLTN